MAEKLSPASKATVLQKDGIILASSENPSDRALIFRYLFGSDEERKQIYDQLVTAKEAAMDELLCSTVKESPDLKGAFKQEVLQVDPLTGAKKMDLEKVRMDLIPYDVLLELGKVYTMGAKKYGPYNWSKGMAWSRPFAALIRHLSAWQMRENKDPESGLSHLVHAAWNVFTLIAFELRGLGTDDRP